MNKKMKILIVTDGLRIMHPQDLVKHLAAYLSNSNISPHIEIVAGTAEAVNCFKNSLDYDYLIFPQSLQSEIVSIVAFLKIKAKLIILQEEKPLETEASHWVGPTLILFHSIDEQEFIDVMAREPEHGHYASA